MHRTFNLLIVASVSVSEGDKCTACCNMPPRKLKSGNKEVFAELGIPNIQDLELDDCDDSDGDDSILESELDAILSGQAPEKPRIKRRPELNIMDIEKMANECVKDINTDDEESLSADEELMDELVALTGIDKSTDYHDKGFSVTVSRDTTTADVPIINILNERLKLYKDAEAAAKLTSDNSKLRRYSRAIKTLESQIKSAKSGNFVNEEDIPPVVSIPKVKAPASTVTTPTVIPSTNEPPVIPPALSKPAPVPQHFDGKTVDIDENQDISPNLGAVNPQLIKRRNQYKVAALKAKKAGDTKTALSYIKIAKQIESAMEAEKSGQLIDLSNMPPSPPLYSGSNSNQTAAQNISSEDKKLPLNWQADEQGDASNMIEKAALEAANDPIDPNLFNAPPPPSNILEALEQRLEKFKSTKEAAATEGNKSKVRRLNRIVQQYEEAIKHYKAGKPVDLEELPIPPGFAPIPLDGTTDNTEPSEPSDAPTKVFKPSPAIAQPASLQRQKNVTELPKERTLPVQRANSSSIVDAQLQFLLERQKLFRQAAIKAKQKGDIEQAKEYLRTCKGFDRLIDATQSGLPIDRSTIPPPPGSEADYVVIDAPEVNKSDLDNRSTDRFSVLERGLREQVELCEKYHDKYFAIGDKESAEKFQNLMHESKKRLIGLEYYKWNNQPVPEFHYETRVFSIRQCNADLDENDIEVTVEKGINLPGKPESVDCYVKIELPIPSDSPQRAKTHVVYNTNNPVFQETFKLQINRKSRLQLRAFKRHSLKCEVFSKGGFFRGDTSLGVASVKLVTLETKYIIHDCFDVLQGRKPTGGKLEIKIRLRDPLLKTHMEQLTDKWIVFSNT